ncbi:MAG TPA: hypothetical protein VK525_00150 [Candidatus Saccharimonadales bacterium]|jgi:hypothetical protein|nr:hypothetical protein [Candidatus Saccharimonadales bacterium]
MKVAPILLLCAVPLITAGATSYTRIKIDTVPNEYTPANATFHEPVSMSGFHFEVNPETVRARVVVDYTYPDEQVYSQDDDAKGPQPTLAQIPGLNYDPQAHTIVYAGEGKTTVCANVVAGKGLFGKHLKIKNTGSCVVTSEDAKHAEDDGWDIHRFKAIDTYFEVR